MCSARPCGKARWLCPRGKFGRPRMDHCREESWQIVKIVAVMGAVLEQMSTDESCLELSTLSEAARPSRPRTLPPAQKPVLGRAPG